MTYPDSSDILITKKEQPVELKNHSFPFSPSTADPPPYIDGIRINSPHYLAKIKVTSAGSHTFTLVVSQYEKQNTINYTLRVRLHATRRHPAKGDRVERNTWCRHWIVLVTNILLNSGLIFQRPLFLFTVALYL